MAGGIVVRVLSSLALIPELSMSTATRGRSAANRRACASGVNSFAGNGRVPSCFSFSKSSGSASAARSAEFSATTVSLGVPFAT